MDKKILLIIDPQIDFITGSLPVPGAEMAMNALAEYIGSHNAEYSHIVVTADRHPMRHCSFKSEGGEWPHHCIADSVGAAIWPPIMNELLKTPDKATIVHKGEKAFSEEYSLFKNAAATECILHIINTNNIRQIDICGLAGDVCVADSIRDFVAMKLPQKIKIFSNFTPSIDGGKTLNSIISELGL